MKTALELFNHRYSEDERFSWLEMIDFAEAYASQSKEECANYARSKAVTDGEIEEAAMANFPEYWDGNISETRAYHYGFDACAKWMREQQGEGAKERYKKAVADYEMTFETKIDWPYTTFLKIAAGLTDKQ